MYSNDELKYLPHHLQLAAVLGARIEVLFREMDLPEYPGEWKPLGYYMHSHPSHRYRIHPDDADSFKGMNAVLDANMLRFSVTCDGEVRNLRVSRCAQFDGVPVYVMRGPWIRILSAHNGVATYEVIHKGRTESHAELLARQEIGDFHRAEEDSGDQDTRTRH